MGGRAGACPVAEAPQQRSAGLEPRGSPLLNMQPSPSQDPDKRDHNTALLACVTSGY